MAIVKKSELETHLIEFTARYENLKRAVTGTEPNPNIYDQYSGNPDQYKKDFVEIDLGRLDYLLTDFDGALKNFKAIKKLQAPKLGHNR